MIRNPPRLVPELTFGLCVLGLSLLTGCGAETKSAALSSTTEKAAAPSSSGDQSAQKFQLDCAQSPRELLLFVAQNQQPEEVRTAAFIRIAEKYLQSNQFSQASEMLEQLAPPAERDEACFNLVKSLLQQDRRTVPLTQTLELILKIEAPAPRDKTLRWIADRFDKQGDVLHYRFVVSRISESKLKSLLMNRLSQKVIGKAGFNQTLYDSRKIPDPAERETALCSLAIVLARKGDQTQAAALIQEIQTPVLQEIANDARVFSYLNSGQLGAAMGLIRSGCTCRTSPLLNSLCYDLIKGNSIDQALAVAREIEEPEYKYSVLYHAASELFERGEIQRAEAVILQANHADKADVRQVSAEEEERRISSQASFASLLIKQGDLERIQAYSAQVDINVFRKYKGLHKLVGKRIQAGQLDQALALTETFPEEDVFALVAEHLAEQGKFKQAVQTALKIEDSYHRSAALAPIVAQLLKKDDLDEAFEVLQKVDDIGFQCTGPPSLRYHNSPHHWHYDHYIYEKMITKLLEADRPDQALAVTHLLHESKERIGYAKHLMKELVRMEKYDAMAMVALKFTADLPYQEQLIEMAIGSLMDADQDELANQIARKQTNKNLQAFAEFQIVAQLVDRRKINEAHERAQQIQHPAWQAESQAKVAYGLMMSQQRELAQKVIEHLDLTRLRPESIARLVSGLVFSEQLEQALFLSNQIRIKQDRLPALMEITEGLVGQAEQRETPTPEESGSDHKSHAIFTPEEQQLARRIVQSIQGD
ncbi:hypothetical protein Pan153_30210 [Gimesia panareensis]|uniref:Tetratricopeptide repeat protein n=1 Tax=Gimesia panareensis TaxID=2527978 RepID=A0A518FPT4_9PLAN|nr:hypothetical protein [Gimesia panareensis]QDV18364.1 hypothetical protein Pan153_30210 [Gimesia panareensis]